MLEMKLCLLLILCSSTETKPKLTLNEYFDFTNYPSLSLSPSGQHLLIQSRRPSWNSNSYENSLWLYNIETKKKQLITKVLSESLKPQWSPSGHWIAFLLNQNSITSSDEYPKANEYIYLYSVISNQWLPIYIGKEIPLALTWSNDDFSLYFVTFASMPTKEDENLQQVEWKDVIQHRLSNSNQGSSIYRLDIEKNNQTSSSTKRYLIKNVPFLITELVFVPFEEKLVLMYFSTLLEKMEMYSFNLQNVSTLSRLTNNDLWENELRLSNDNRHVLFLAFDRESSQGKLNSIQQRLYSLDLTNGHIERLAKDFDGNIAGYMTKPDGGVYILGQLGTETQIYTQQSPTHKLIFCQGWNGTYERISLSSKRNGPIAFIYSSFERPKEVYLMDSIDQLQSAQVLTSENKLFTQRELPKTKVYQWKNNEDQRTIEGILHYPPGKFQSNNLPLFVLIHGGPGPASVNSFTADWYTWAPLAASEGWLVFEPNYRGSFGYGDQFHNEVFLQPLSRPGRDILSGVDQLVNDGIADPNRLAIGGYSYGGFLTNWLITQTTRFNAALSGAGAVEYVSAWGTIDMSTFIPSLFGGYPWEVPQNYQSESPIYHLSRVRTPTHIITGEKDVQVDKSQSFMLERGLHYLGIPVQLLVFPNEGHGLNKNPWYGKIKVREELKWLHKYGNRSLIITKN
jgi:dipeptidyl aminopeptidase/acylaminoacyl peptidase